MGLSLFLALAGNAIVNVALLSVSRQLHAATSDLRWMVGGYSLMATGFSRGFLFSAAVGLLALIIAVAAIRVTRKDLSGADPMVAPVG